ncbi:MAG: DUF480 domain-containing protein [Pirellulales bacterium]
MDTESDTKAEARSAPRWQPLEAIARRVLGVLIEKAKTTAENYPLSLNALRAGSNQKSNRAPLMQLEEPQIEEALEQLRQLGAVALVQGGGRVDRYRHLAYEWLGVEKLELAVMAELLLRGTQTVGELRGRAARMEPIKDIGELTPTLESLQSKGLIVYLTPPGRGSIVTHALYLEREMEKVRRELGHSAAPAPSMQTETFSTSATQAAPPVVTSDSAALREQLNSLRHELTTAKRELEAARSEFATTAEELRRDLEELKRQLGN